MTREEDHNDPSADDDPELGPVVESFLERLRRGERPSLTDLVLRHPDLADQLRELIPALVEVEQLGGPTGPFDRTETRRTAGDGVGGEAPPERLGDYRILRRIERGGMGVVYEAERESLKSRVALKVMLPGYRADPKYLRRFHREARSAASLHHTNIVSVFDYGEQDGILYYAMQFIDGQPLHRVLDDVRRLRAKRSMPESPDPTRTAAEGLLTGRFASPGAAAQRPDDTPATTVALDGGTPTSPAAAGPAADAPPSSGVASLGSEDGGRRYHREVARICAQAADALDYAHRRGVLHRDIKPSNLLLDALGNIWVTDFGLAKLEGAEDVSQSQDVVGTLRYIPPERFRGESEPRGDIYALGATLYELLTLRPAFDGKDRLELIERISHQPPEPPRGLDRQIPRDLERIVLKALAKDPKDRFKDAKALGDELRRFLDGRPLTIRAVPAYERFWRWCKRNPKLAAANIVAAALTTILAIVSTFAAWNYREQRNELRFEQGRTKAGLNRAEQAEHEARLALGQSLISEGAALRRTGRSGQRFESLDRLGRAAQVLGADPEGRKRLPEIRNHAIAASWLIDLRVRRHHDCGENFSITCDAALERCAVLERSGAVVVRRLDDDRELIRLPGPDRRDFWHAWVDFSPDGELLVSSYLGAAAGDNLLRIWHLGQRELLASLWSRGGPRFHPDARRVLYSAPEGGIAIWDRDERRVVRRLPLDFAPHNYVLDPAGRRLAVNKTDEAKPRLVILDLETGRVLADWRSQVGTESLAWSADGQLLAVGSHGGDGSVYVWNVRRGALESVLQGHTANIISAQFAHSGYLLVTAAWDNTTRLWDAASGEPLAMATGNFSYLSRDGRRLVFTGGGKLGVWDVATAPECRTLHPGMLGNRTERRDATGVVFQADFSPDGRLVATCGSDGVRLWETDTGRELAQLKAGFCRAVLFHPDGQSLISAGDWGLYRWPMRLDPDDGLDAIRVGPPELLMETAADHTIPATWLPDHRTVALVDSANSRVLLIDSSRPHPARNRATVLDSSGDRGTGPIAVSPDGRWLAGGGWKVAGVRVWDLRRRRLERILRPDDTVGDTSFFIGFSPNGQWLVSCTLSDPGPVYHFWRLGTWELGQRIVQEGGGNYFHRPAFTADGRLMALGIAPDQVMLADASTGRELARLTTLQPITPTPLAFSPDGTKLVAGTNQRTALVWDLRMIREQLVPMGLDWDAPPYPVASAGSEASGTVPPPRSVRVVGEVIEPQARRAAEMAEMDRRLSANPDDADALIHRGWLRLLMARAAESIADLERGLRLRPDDTDALFLLARAHSQTNNLPAAHATLEKYLGRSPGDIDARLSKGQVALQIGRLQEAADDFTKVLDIDPGRVPVRYRRAEVWLRLGRLPEALTDLAPLIQRYPKDPALYELRSRVHERLGQRELALADMKQVGAEYYNQLAWRLATGPAALRDPEQALALARKAVAMEPDTAIYLNTLGVAQYRAGRHAEAIDTLEKSLVAGRGESDAFDLFFLAMARHELGQIARARADFDHAVRWRREHPDLSQPGWSEELDRFRAEAEAVLAGPASELPDDVFAPAR
jgi:serine/threonine protein kinase/WD40 repeat protein/tetratricopeptide (TPR) repeat protein